MKPSANSARSLLQNKGFAAQTIPESWGQHTQNMLLQQSPAVEHQFGQLSITQSSLLATQVLVSLQQIGVFELSLQQLLPQSCPSTWRHCSAKQSSMSVRHFPLQQKVPPPQQLFPQACPPSSRHSRAMQSSNEATHALTVSPVQHDEFPVQHWSPQGNPISFWQFWALHESILSTHMFVPSEFAQQKGLSSRQQLFPQTWPPLCRHWRAGQSSGEAQTSGPLQHSLFPQQLGPHLVPQWVPHHHDSPPLKGVDFAPVRKDKVFKRSSKHYITCGYAPRGQDNWKECVCGGRGGGNCLV